MKSCFDIRATATEWINDNADDWDLVATLSRVSVVVDCEN